MSSIISIINIDQTDEIDDSNEIIDEIDLDMNNFIFNPKPKRIKKNKNKLSTQQNMDQYLDLIIEKCKQNIKFKKMSHLEKMTNNELVIPTIYNYHNMLNYNYNVEQLRKISKEYKLKLAGNKNEIFYRIYTYLQISSYVIKIQKNIRGKILRKYIQLKGPGFWNKSLCVNNVDFLTMDDLNSITNEQFISFKDENNMIYGFDIISLYNLIKKSKGELRNPYSRSLLPKNIEQSIIDLIQIGRILNYKIDIEIENDNISNLPTKKIIELRVLKLFQTIDELGNYSNPEWFNQLDRTKLIKFFNELYDIWDYRAQLSHETKISICPPFGNPFVLLRLNLRYETDINIIKIAILNVLEKLVNSGITNDNKSLGAYYILSALTLVNENAANALPWLYQSVSHY
jgi:hypothetical protein